jgi:2-polyprenyl-6-hydroxyphenyl methylase/3-demethylubiquinone-9 3-methyltransferase
MSSGPTQSSAANLDPAEVDAFARIAAEWWDPSGKFRPLHQIGPARLAFIRAHVARHLRPADASEPSSRRPFAGLSLLDIGCGGGLIAEPLARLGARVTGIDPAERNVEVARLHARQSGLDIDYRAATVEALVAESAQFDVVLCLEVVEHVPDPAAFMAECARLVRPGGLLVASTINRTVKAWLLAIVGAEYVLRWLPAGTHKWERFVTPDEMARYLAAARLTDIRTEGMVYSPLTDSWSLSADTDVNYLVAAAKPAGE